jgi:hypothetical protein
MRNTDFGANFESESDIGNNSPETDSSDDMAFDTDRVLPVNLVEADDVCQKLSYLIIDNKISKTDIFYKQIKSVVHSIHNPGHFDYEPDVVEFYNSIEYVGGKSVVNLVIGPMSLGERKKGKAHFDPQNHRSLWAIQFNKEEVPGRLLDQKWIIPYTDEFIPNLG